MSYLVRLRRTLHAATRRPVVWRGLKVAIVVTPILTLLNHDEEILTGQLGVGFWLQVGATFLVPFAVSVISGGMATIEADTRPRTGHVGSARGWLKRVGIVVIVGAVVGAFYLLDLGKYLSFEELKIQRTALLSFYDRNTVAVILAFIGIYTAQTAVSIPGGMILTLAAGAVFGPFAGTLFVNVGATAGATLAAMFTRFLFRDFVERKLGDRAQRVSEGFARDGMSYLLFLRFIPLFPFWFVNLAGGLTRMPIGRFALGTSLGILPGSFVYAYAGSQLATLESPADIVSPGMLLAFILLGLLSLTPAMHRKWRERRVALQTVDQNT